MVSEATDRGRQKLAVERKNDWTKMVSFVHDSSGKYCMPLFLEKESAAFIFVGSLHGWIHSYW
jgi:hypothetical protein